MVLETLLLAAVAAAFLFFAVDRARKAGNLRAELEKTRIALAAAKAKEGDADGLKQALETERAARARTEAEIAAARATLAERERALVDLRARMDSEFKATAA